MIYHHFRSTLKDGVTEAQQGELLASLQNQGREISAVRQFLVGREVGGEFQWGATFVFDDLDGYWAYLMHPAHLRSDEIGLPLVERFISYDTTDDPDPEFGAKVAALHQRRYAALPELARLVRDLPNSGSGLEG
ncbi:Dabb family protein [Paractinoplanes lichenicola]|uniref:Dabb family protein n=1 Tax=Paractinoplanes lichenicola TaxID=2802976 RepID=A0ABS1VE71_9ACTN|nr:Dabb family protein [Actinoplanes lichenicola]MBL7252969.1 Dabb family protein [Actinoplanes lichenicola]